MPLLIATVDALTLYVLGRPIGSSVTGRVSTISVAKSAQKKEDVRCLPGAR